MKSFYDYETIKLFWGFSYASYNSGRITHFHLFSRLWLSVVRKHHTLLIITQISFSPTCEQPDETIWDISALAGIVRYAYTVAPLLLSFMAIFGILAGYWNERKQIIPNKSWNIELSSRMLSNRKTFSSTLMRTERRWSHPSCTYTAFGSTDPIEFKKKQIHFDSLIYFV